MQVLRQELLQQRRVCRRNGETNRIAVADRAALLVYLLIGERQLLGDGLAPIRRRGVCKRLAGQDETIGINSRGARGERVSFKYLLEVGVRKPSARTIRRFGSPGAGER